MGGLATLKVLGLDLLTDAITDVNEQAPHEMCKSGDGEPWSLDEKKEIVLQAESLIPEVEARKKEFEDAREEAEDPLVLAENAEDEEDDDGTVLRRQDPRPNKKARDDDDDLLGGGIVADEL